MAISYLRSKACLVLLFLTANQVLGQFNENQTTSPAARPLVKRPEGRKYKTILSADSGGLRGLISTMVYIEIEQSIKRYLFDHPYLLPSDAFITSIDDFDINLVDYFDCMTGVSIGANMAIFLASRGGMIALMGFPPEIVARYGAVPSGGAQALRIYFREFGALLYPPGALGEGGSLFDLSNPNSAGVSTPVFTSDGARATAENAFGNMTLADLDTTVLVPALDLISGYAVFFVQNTLKYPPVTSSAKLVPRSDPKSAPYPGGQFVPDLVFDEEKDYYLSDVGVGAGAAPIFDSAVSVSAVNNFTEEFLLVDGAVPIEDAVLFASYFVASESYASGLEDIAIISVGNVRVISDYTGLANAGLAGYVEGLAFRTLYEDTGRTSKVSLMDYIYYSDPNTKPYQYLRIQKSVEADSEEGMAVGALDQVPVLDIYERIGTTMAEEYRPAIDIFVRDFIFG